jgi:two-component system cell cycle sensor histidine kinase/response regulator CckA
MTAALSGRHRVPSVLVVDDDEVVRLIARRSLEAAGYHVWEASDGTQALGYLLQGVVDVVVTDIRMPKMDGWELLTHLRSMSPRIPTLLMSGYDIHLGTSEISELVLAKPFRPEQLTNLVRQLLAGSQQQSA